MRLADLVLDCSVRLPDGLRDGCLGKTEIGGRPHEGMGLRRVDEHDPGSALGEAWHSPETDGIDCFYFPGVRQGRYSAPTRRPASGSANAMRAVSARGRQRKVGGS